MERFWIIDNFLTVEECSIILEKYKLELKLEQAEVTINGVDTSSESMRKSSVGFIDNIEILDGKIKTKLEELIKVKGFKVTGLGPYQFTEYKVGGFYDWHTDSSDIYKNRFVSIVLQLNNEYDGGCLELNVGDGNKNIIKLEKGIGNLCIFYSNLLHRVTPVTEGVRYSLVNWIQLEPKENFVNTLI